MSTDLDTRLRSLTDVTPPSHGPLGTEELHRRASRRQQRTTGLRAIPAVVVVVAVLAGAVALTNRSTTTDVVVGPPDATEVPASSISERDRQIIDFLRSAAELRHQLDREMVLSTVYANTNAVRGRNELHEQWETTDVAVAAYTERRQVVVPGSGSIPADELGLVEAIQQADNRVARLETNRRSVESMQTDALGQIDPYANTSAALQGIAVGYLQSVDDPDVFRGVLTASNLGAFATSEAAMAATLTIAVGLGYYAGTLPKGADPTAARGVCGDDAAAASDACAVYADALDRSVDRDRLEATFLTYASGEQKQRYRAADAGSSFDQMVATAFEDGFGRNDLTGAQLGSVPIDPGDWQGAVLQRLDRLALVEQELYDSIGTDAVEPPPTSDGGGSSPGTPPSLEPEPTPGDADVSPTTMAPADGTTTGDQTTGRDTETPPTTTTGGP